MSAFDLSPHALTCGRVADKRGATVDRKSAFVSPRTDNVFLTFRVVLLES